MGKTTESLSKQQTNNRIQIGKIGRTIGFDGSLRLFVQTDFPQSISADKSYYTSHIAHPSLRVESYEYLPNKDYAKIRFYGIDTSEAAKALTNHILYTTIAQSRQDCTLGEDEFFWFEIIGFSIIEDDEILGRVEDIERIGATDYLVVVTDPKLCTPLKLKKRFLIPYIDPYIISTDTKAHHIYTKNAKALLLAS